MWAFGMALVALIPALALLRSGHRQEAASGTGFRDGTPMSAEAHTRVPSVYAIAGRASSVT